jgi:hypothetical protein
MAPLALALHLALASSPAPGVAQAAPGPFRGGELVRASAGALGGDLAVLGAGYLTLQLFAGGAIDPTAANFRHAAYALAASALVVPPLVAVALARLGPDSRGSFWRALLLASAGQAVAIAAGLVAAPHFWVIVPVQLAAVSAGTSYGLHWGRRPRHTPLATPTTPERVSSSAPSRSPILFPICS